MEAFRVKKVTFATLLGGFLGIFDGLTALFTPEVRDQIVGIVIGSTVKGLLTGVIVGYFAKQVHSLALGMLFGLAVGAFFAYLILQSRPHPEYHAPGEPGGPDRRLRDSQISKLEVRSEK